MTKIIAPESRPATASLSVSATKEPKPSRMPEGTP
jgi:hypothetical protein